MRALGIRVLAQEKPYFGTSEPSGTPENAGFGSPWVNLGNLESNLGSPTESWAGGSGRGSTLEWGPEGTP